MKANRILGVKSNKKQQHSLSKYTRLQNLAQSPVALAKKLTTSMVLSSHSSFPFPFASTLFIAVCTCQAFTSSANPQILYIMILRLSKVKSHSVLTPTLAPIYGLLLRRVHSEQSHTFPIGLRYERHRQSSKVRSNWIKHFRTPISIAISAKCPQFAGINVSTLVHIAAIEDCLCTTRLG